MGEPTAHKRGESGLVWKLDAAGTLELTGTMGSVDGEPSRVLMVTGDAIDPPLAWEDVVIAPDDAHRLFLGLFRWLMAIGYTPTMRPPQEWGPPLALDLRASEDSATHEALHVGNVDHRHEGHIVVADAEAVAALPDEGQQ